MLLKQGWTSENQGIGKAWDLENSPKTRDTPQWLLCCWPTEQTLQSQVNQKSGEGKVAGEKRKWDPYIIFNCFECLKKNCWQMFDKSVDVFGKQIIDVYVEK